MQVKKLKIMAVAIVLLATANAPAMPADPAGPAVRLEEARLLPHDQGAAAVGVILEELLAGADVRAATMFEAEALFLAGRFDEAAATYAAAARDLAGTDFADDAAFGRIRALEAAGQDAEARSLWQAWHADHPDSPLSMDANLAAAWNAVRSSEAARADVMVESTVADETWADDDPRVVLLRAATAYTAGQAETALDHLADVRQAGPLTAVALTLEGLCRQSLGQEFAAAVAYQELIDEHPESPLQGYAHMAKGDIFGTTDSYLAADTEFTRAARRTTRPDHRAEAEYMAAACRFLGGREQQGLEAMHAVVTGNTGTDLAARALFSLGEMRWLQGEYERAIVRFNEVLSGYFAHELAGSALYRTGRCLDALGRTTEANGTYQAVAEGHPYAPEAPAAVYLAGVGLFEQGRFMEAATYFQLIMDRYAGTGTVYVFESAAQQELVEAGLCMLGYSYNQAEEFGLMAGAPHLALQKMPASESVWRAYALLLDADALAAVDRFVEAQVTLATLKTEFPDHAVGIRANRLLAWTYARQDRQDLAIETEEALLARHSAQDDRKNLGGALLTIANSHFNAKRYDEAATRYEEYAQTYGDQGHRLEALYQAGLCYVRLGRAGDAVDTWSVVTAESPAGDEARKAWLRAGDILFQAGHYDAAREQFAALMTHFPDPAAQVAATLRLGRCDYNEGQSEAALARFRTVQAQWPSSREAVEATEGIANILYGQGMAGDREALHQLVTAHADNPLAPEAGFELAMDVYRSGDYTAAAEAFEALCARYPRYSATDRNFFHAAESREKAGETDRARAGWSDFQRHFPASELAPAALFHLAAMRFNDGSYHVAVEDFNRVLAMPAEDEVHAAALYNLALSHRILGNRESARTALEDYRRHVSADSTRNVAVVRTLGEIHQEAGRLDAAVTCYREAIDLGADAHETVELNYLAGQCLKDSGDLQGALGAYAASIASPDKTNGFRLSALAHAADLHEQDGDFDGALAAYRDLIEHATDPALVSAAKDRVEQLETALGQ
ncbi:MAG: tetratricopeptide repeat protein [bacterium]|nr:tetratricopeptide repeat protein [bacterium]